MIVSGTTALAGNVISNLAIASGNVFPAQPAIGELFFRNDINALHIYNNSSWVKVVDNALGEAQVRDSDLTSIANLTGVTGLLRKTAENLWQIDTSAYITGTTISGDISGSGLDTIVLTLPNIATAGTYTSTTINAKGQVIAGTNPTTLAGYGITDATPSSHLLDSSLHITSAQNAWIDAITATSTEINYLTGSTSNIQSQLNSKSDILHSHIITLNDGISQSISANIDLDTIGIIAGANILLAFDDVANVITISTSSTLAGNATTASALATPRSIALTGDINWSATFDGTTNVTSAAILPDIATAGTYTSTTINAKGQVIAGTNPTTLAGYSITDATPLSHSTDTALHLTPAQNTWIDAITATSTEINYLTGITWNLQSTLSGKLDYGKGFTLNVGEQIIAPTGTSIQIVDAPVNTTDAVNKGYVDSSLAGLSWKDSAIAATTSNIVLTGLQTIDGVVLSNGDRVLVKNQTNQVENGIYIVSATAWSRSADFTSTTPLQALNSLAIFVEQGLTQADTGWTQTATITSTLDPATFTQFNGASGITAGAGLSKTGNQLDVNLGAGIAQLPTDEVGIDVYPSGGLYNTTDGISQSALTSAQLSLTNVGIAGTYRSVTTDIHGRIIAGTNPTTLAGYGITDAVAQTTFSTHTHTLDSLSDVAVTAAAPSNVLRWNGTAWSNATLAQAGIVSANASIVPGTFTKVTVDNKGLVTGTANIVKADIDALNVDASTLSGLSSTQFVRRDLNSSIGGSLTLSGGLFTTGASTQNIGTVTNKFNTVYATTFSGTSTTAQYADLAENYIADAEYAPGTVLAIGGTKEVTQSTVDNDIAVAGVVTTNPAHLMNSDIQGEYVVALALIGRVPCKVTGNIKKGDILVSNGNGFARTETNPQYGRGIGKALENFSGISGTIEVLVGKL